LLFVVLRLIGALLLVISVLLCGVWFFKRSRFFSLYQGGPAQLKVLESRSLGYRNTLFVVGYAQHRFLLAASTTGVNLVSLLPDAAPAEPAAIQGRSFAEQLGAMQDPKT
jgi:flagellar biogenesis protein FliO